MKRRSCEKLVDEIIESYRREVRRLKEESERLDRRGMSRESVEALNESRRLLADLGELRRARDRMVSLCERYLEEE